MEKKNFEQLKKALGYKNDLAVPRILKVVINVGVGRLSQQPNFDEKILPEIIKELSLIVGQKPSPTKAKQSIAGFKTRAGQIVGLKAVLRRGRMNDFVDRLIKIVLPRVRDFRGISLESVDENGHLNIGIRDHLVFPEINPEESKIDFGMEISIVCKAKSKEEAIELYRLMGFPMKKA